jgi:hypothetical protein
MILPRSRSLALGCALFLAATAAGVAAQDTPAATKAPEAEETAQQPAPETGEPAEATETGESADSTEATEDKRICRYVRLDMSSRRKTKVCRTVDEWRELNNIR